MAAESDATHVSVLLIIHELVSESLFNLGDALLVRGAFDPERTRVANGNGKLLRSLSCGL